MTRGSRRAVNWFGGFQGSITDIEFAAQEVAISWAYWPAGVPNFNFTPPVVNPPDQTLVRTLTKLNAIAKSPGQSCGALTFGICTFDAANPEDYEGVIVGPGIVPDSFYTNQDWVIRVTMAVPSFDSDFLGFFQTLDKEFESRAMRKLPPGTGLLACLSWNPVDEASGMIVSWYESSYLAIKVPA